GILPEHHHFHLLEGRGIEGGEYLPAGGKHPRPGRLALAQVGRQFAHFRTQQPVTDARLPAGFELDLRARFRAHRTRAGCARRASRNWNSTLVTSSRSSTGFCTRSLAPDCSSVDWLCGLLSPVITSTGRRRLP